MKVVKSCGAFVLDNDKVLVIKQKKLGNYGFPKGHMESNETEKETSIREVKEETGVDIEIISDKRYFISYPKDENTNKEVVYFLAKLKNKDNEKNQEEEISEILWLNINDVQNIITFENMKALWIEAKNDLRR